MPRPKRGAVTGKTVDQSKQPEESLEDLQCVSQRLPETSEVNPDVSFGDESTSSQRKLVTGYSSSEDSDAVPKPGDDEAEEGEEEEDEEASDGEDDDGSDTESAYSDSTVATEPEEAVAQPVQKAPPAKKVPAKTEEPKKSQQKSSVSEQPVSSRKSISTPTSSKSSKSCKALACQVPLKTYPASKMETRPAEKAASSSKDTTPVRVKVVVTPTPTSSSLKKKKKTSMDKSPTAETPQQKKQKIDQHESPQASGSESGEERSKMSSLLEKQWPTDIKEFSADKFLTSSEKKKRHSIKNSVRCPYCPEIHTTKSEVQLHIERSHPMTLEEEGVFMASRRIYHLRREGVRILPKKPFNMHCSMLPELPTETRNQVKAVIRNLLVESMVLVGDDRRNPVSNYMEFKSTLNEMIKDFPNYPVRP